LQYLRAAAIIVLQYPTTTIYCIAISKSVNNSNLYHFIYNGHDATLNISSVLSIMVMVLVELEAALPHHAMVGSKLDKEPPYSICDVATI
jgi:hypothetical protein